jgi:voltage-gated potassium channel Kch
VILLAAPVALVSGTLGFHQYDLEHLGHASWLTSLYHATQLFILHLPHLEGDVNPTLEAGRWLAAAVFGVAAASTLFHVFATEWSLFRLWFTRDHVVVCGLGKLGTLLALELKKAGQAVVAIEDKPAAEGLQRARSEGIPVLIGDACTVEMLARARAHKARRVLAVCSEDRVNVGIAALAGSLMPDGGTGRKATECWLFVADPGLRSALGREHLFKGEELGRYRVNVRGLDLYSAAARKAFREYPLDHLQVGRESKARVHLVIVGFGEMGQALALQAARIGHFANGSAWPDGHKLAVTLVDPDIELRWAAFRADYQAYPEICDVDLRAWSADDPALVPNLAGLVSGDGARQEVVTFAVCLSPMGGRGPGELHENPFGSDDAVNLSLAMKLAPLVRQQGAQVLTLLGERRGFGAFLDPETRSQALEPNLKTIGIVEDLCSSASLIDEEQDRLAQANHQLYRSDLAARRKAGEDLAPKPGEVEWDLLDEYFKDSNRQFADHLEVKLRALGYKIGPAKAGHVADIEAKPDQVELLARMEHARWCAERRLAGWSVGPRDDAAKRHPDLVRWEDLPDPEKRIDVGLVKGIEKMLGEVGKGAYR